MCSSFRSNGRGVYFSIVAHTTLWFSVVMLLTYMWHMVERYHNFPWLKLEMVAYTVFTFLYLIASTIAVAFGDAAYSAAGVRRISIFITPMVLYEEMVYESSCY